MSQAVDEERDADGLGPLLDHLRRSRGFDFSGYKRASLERRIQKRMADVGVDSYPAYLDHLEANPSEFTDLFNTILINVTGFFRDRDAWDYVAEEVVPKLIEDTPRDQPLRVWSAACASGEEAYTAAIVLAEALGEDQFRRRVKIYATDVDEDALATARLGRYTSDELKGVPPELLDRYFEESPAGRSFRADLRRSVIFGRNDLVQDAPISRIDLLVSRNALMYFTPETQAKILAHFNFALNQTGFLFLGKSEMLITHTEWFLPYDLKWRVFRKVPHSRMRDRLAFIVDGDAGDGPDNRPVDLHSDVLDVVPMAQLVVDRSGFVTFINRRARDLFGLGPADVGRPLQDLEVSYRPVDLRTALAAAVDTGKAVDLGPIEARKPGGEAVTLDVAVTPVVFAAGQHGGASITFDDVTDFTRLRAEHERQQQQLEAAYEELQSTVEELETTNEELQSTNEELETMNEELQSTNDELETMNDEQRMRATELDRVNLFLEGILGNLRVGVVVLDRDQNVQVWNEASTELWGLRPDEVQGRHLQTLDLGLPVDQLREAIRDALAESPETTDVSVEAVNRRGRPMRVDVRVMPLNDAIGRQFGVLLLVTPEDLPAAS
jgi:two-component system CheB/CheR fusion protein